MQTITKPTKENTAKPKTSILIQHTENEVTVTYKDKRDGLENGKIKNIIEYFVTSDIGSGLLILGLNIIYDPIVHPIQD